MGNGNGGRPTPGKRSRSAARYGDAAFPQQTLNPGKRTRVQSRYEGRYRDSNAEGNVDQMAGDGGFFLDEKQRYRAEEKFQGAMGTMRTYFVTASSGHKTKLITVSEEHESLGSVLLGIAVGALAPGLLGKGLGALANLLPNTDEMNQIGVQVIENADAVAEAISKKLESAVGSAGDLGKKKSALDASNGLADTAEKAESLRWYEGFETSMIRGFEAAANERFEMTDVELLAGTLALHSPAIDVSWYSSRIASVVDGYKNTVAPVKSRGKRAFWVSVGKGKPRLAVGYRPGLMNQLDYISDKPVDVRNGHYAFDRWVNPALQQDVVAREMAVQEERKELGNEVPVFRIGDGHASVSMDDWEKWPFGEDG